MDTKLDNLFLNIRNTIFTLMQEKQVEIDALTFDLGVNRETFVNNFSKRIEDFTFYLQTLSLLENWEG